MARTIAEIQNEILVEKGKQAALSGLTNESNTSIWKLWTNIVATAIWLHEKIVERNALISRPHTLNWYREQALNYLHGRELVWKEGSYQFYTSEDDTDEIIENLKIVKHCAVSEVDLSTIIKPDKGITQIFSDYFHNQVGVVYIKVATNDGELISPITPDQLTTFREYISRIKDAGNQVVVQSMTGDKLELTLNVFVDPLQIYIDSEDISKYQEIITENSNEITNYNDFNVNNGVLLSNPSIKPIEVAIKNYLKNIEFNGAFVKSFLIDAIQKVEGVKIPVLTSVKTANAGSADLNDTSNIEYFIPRAGYFDIGDQSLVIKINYIPYTFYRDNRTQ